MAQVDPRTPGLSFLAVLAVPGLVSLLSFAYAFLARSDAPGRNAAFGVWLGSGLLAFGAGIPALYTRAPRPLRWAVATIDLGAFLFVMYAFTHAWSLGG